MIRMPALLLAAAALFASVPTPVLAAPFPNLQCVDAKDLRGIDLGPGRLDITPRDLEKFNVDRNCRLDRPKLKMVCTAAETAPIETIPSKNLRNSFLCYQIKCPPFSGNKTIETEDRLGAGAIEIKIKSSKRILCLPTPRIDAGS